MEKLIIEAGLWDMLVDAVVLGPHMIDERLRQLVPEWKIMLQGGLAGPSKFVGNPNTGHNAPVYLLDEKKTVPPVESSSRNEGRKKGRMKVCEAVRDSLKTHAGVTNKQLSDIIKEKMKKPQKYGLIRIIENV